MAQRDPLSRWSEACAADRGLKGNRLYCWRLALRWFDYTLGRPAIVADLNSGTIRSILEKLLSGGHSRSFLKQTASTLFALWRFVHESGGTRLGPPESVPEFSRAPVTRKPRHKNDCRWRKRLPEFTPLVETVGIQTAEGTIAVPEVKLPTFDGAIVAAAQPERIEPAKRKETRWRGDVSKRLAKK